MKQSKQKHIGAFLLLFAVSPLFSEEKMTMEQIQSQLEELKSQVESMNETQQTMSTDVINLKKLKVSGYFQGRYEWHQDRPLDATIPPSTADKQDSFSVRRGRIKFTYTATPMSQVVIYPDLSTKDGVTLKEAYLKMTEPWTGTGINLVFGQQNWFFGREIERSSSVREVPERARVYRNVFDGERDKGARLEFPSLILPGLNLKAGVFNGNGIKSPHTFDNDPYKHYMGRLAYSFGWLDLGISGESGKRFSKIAAGNAYVKKQHVGADAYVFYELPVIGGGSFGGEWMEGEGVQAPATMHAKNKGWFISEVQNLGTMFQIAARYDLWEPNTDDAVVGDIVRTTTVAAHYFWDDATRITLATEQPNTEDPNDVRDNTTTLQFQFKF